MADFEKLHPNIEPFGYLKPQPTPEPILGPSPAKKTCWAFSLLGGREEWTSIPNPLGPDADGKKPTPKLLEEAGCSTLASYIRDGVSWSVTVYDVIGKPDALVVITTDAGSVHPIAVSGLPALMCLLGKLDPIIGPEVKPAQKPKKKS